ncbi:MAG: heme NO-binding domain-containing protein [Pseudomonadota bacterium]
MRGLVFTEFLDFVEGVAGYDVVDEMILRADPASGGAYTSTGNYPFTELAAMIGALSELLNTPAPELIHAYGKHLFGRFSALYPAFFEGPQDTFSFLESVESIVHVEVRKIYPDAQPPALKAERVGEAGMRLEYRSCRPLGALCLGLIEGCAEHFGERLDVSHQPAEGGLSILVTRVQASAA